MTDQTCAPLLSIRVQFEAPLDTIRRHLYYGSFGRNTSTTRRASTKILAPIVISPIPLITSAMRPNFSPIMRPIRMPTVAMRKVAHPIARAVTTMSALMKPKVTPKRVS